MTPEKIVVQDRDNRDNSYAELLHNKKLRERKGKKGIALRDIARKVHLLARLVIPWQVGYMK